jgi:hypothetical protein
MQNWLTTTTKRQQTDQSKLSEGFASRQPQTNDASFFGLGDQGRFLPPCNQGSISFSFLPALYCLKTYCRIELSAFSYFSTRGGEKEEARKTARMFQAQARLRPKTLRQLICSIAVPSAACPLLTQKLLELLGWCYWQQSSFGSCRATR